MDTRRALQGPGGEGWHAAPVARRRPGALAESPGASGARPRRRRRRRRGGLCKTSAGLLVPLGAPGKRGEREGALRQARVRTGGWEVRLPLGSQRSPPRPEPAASPLPRLPAGPAETVVESLGPGLARGRPRGGWAAGPGQPGGAWGGGPGERVDEAPRGCRGAATQPPRETARAPRPVRPCTGRRDSPAARGDPPARHRAGGSSRGADGAAARPGADLGGGCARRLLRLQAKAGRSTGRAGAAGGPGHPRLERRGACCPGVLHESPAPHAADAADEAERRWQSAAAAQAAAHGRGRRHGAGGPHAGWGAARRPACPGVQPPRPAPRGAPGAEARLPGNAWCHPPPLRR